MLPEETRMQAVRLIKQYPYPGASVEGIMELLDAGYRMEFAHGQTICAEGETAACMYLLTYGKVGVVKQDFSGRERRVATMHAPAIFGHMAMVDCSSRSATCTAEGVVTVVVVDRQTYQHLITEGTEVGRTLRRLLLSSLTEQLSRGNRRLRELTGGAGAGSPSTQRAMITEAELSEVSSELEGWRRHPSADPLVSNEITSDKTVLNKTVPTAAVRPGAVRPGAVRPGAVSKDAPAVDVDGPVSEEGA
ncbi:MAG: cyclic nucleotide-binding domain-containing protein [Oligoflexia bacterium]|nr:cyclic nucleotide-binding domain-containing protein [Oligoflexia bacterium]